MSAEMLLNLVSSVSPVTSEDNASKHQRSESTGMAPWQMAVTAGASSTSGLLRFGQNP